jgi:hypothetical protein
MYIRMAARSQKHHHRRHHWIPFRNLNVDLPYAAFVQGISWPKQLSSPMEQVSIRYRSKLGDRWVWFLAVIADFDEEPAWAANGGGGGAGGGSGGRTGH